MAGKKRVAAKKATTTKKKATTLDITFETDIPKISREGSERKSKYNDLLDKIKERAQGNAKHKVAVLQFPSTGKATSRYTSVKDAVSKREDADHWEVAVRTHAEDDVRLYIKWNEEAEETEPEEDEVEETEAEEEDDEFDF